MDEYLRKRILRIYPGYIVALMFSVLVMVAANPHLLRFVASWRGFVSIISDCTRLQQDSIVGSDRFPHNPYPHFVNASLWTIPIEFRCYLLICVLGLFGLFEYRWLMFFFFLACYVSFAKAVAIGWNVNALDRRFLVFFAAGICAWVWRTKIPICTLVALPAAILLGLSFKSSSAVLLVAPFTLTYLTLYVGYAKPLKAFKWCNTTDLSYGVYLYAFPLQQLMSRSRYGRNPNLMFLAVVPCSMAAAYASWNLIEKRFLRLKSLSIFRGGRVFPFLDRFKIRMFRKEAIIVEEPSITCK